MKLSSITLLAFALPLAACGGGGSGGGSSDTASDPARVVATCVSCHTFDKGGSRRAGPNLFGIVGQVAGVQPGFNFSPAMASSGITWTPEKLDAFLAAPQQVIPGTRMNYPGVSDPAQRKAIVDYLASLK